MKLIPLHAKNGSVRAEALVDDEDFERFGRIRWSYDGRYAVGRVNGRHDYLHRAIAGLVRGDGLEVDHRNRNKLDCRRENLRVTTRAGNNQNLVARDGARSRFRGVSWFKHGRGHWRARFGAKTVGYRPTELEAAMLIEAYRREHVPLAEPDPALIEALAEPAELAA